MLIVKAVLVATALIFGGLNRWSALPRLRRTASTVDAHTVTNVMRVEGLLMIGVFVGGVRAVAQRAGIRVRRIRPCGVGWLAGSKFNRTSAESHVHS